MREHVERASVRINAQISTISPQLHMCQTVCRGEITLRSAAWCLSFIPGCQGRGMHSENRSLHSAWWQKPQCPAFGLQVAGIHRDEPDGRYLGQWALKLNRHGMHFTTSRKSFKVSQLTNCLTLMLNKWWCVPQVGNVCNYANDNNILWILRAF